MSSPSKSGSHLAVMLHAVAGSLLALAAAPAMAYSVTLCAERYTQDLPGAAGTPMWGYRLMSGASGESACGSPAATDAHAPVITVPTGDTTLAITLVNRLTVPTSIVIAGQSLPADGGAPVMAADLADAPCVPTPSAAASSTDPNNPQNCRVRSFTGETGAGGSRTYTFNNLRPGTYLYQSGTHPQVQVQMGLAGMVRQDATLAGSTGRLLFANAAAGFDADVPAVFSEVDVAQHILIDSTLGSANPASWKAGNNSTLNYAPNFFLVNGKVFDGATATDLPVTAPAGARVVLRLANAGLQSRSLMLNKGTVKLLTEDGRPLAAPLEHATVLLPAGKTHDALLAATPPATGTDRSLALFDRRGGADGGLIARLAMSVPTGPIINPIAAQVANEGAAYALQITGSNISTGYSYTGLPTDAAFGSNATGALSWTPVPTGTPVPTSYNITVTGGDGSTSASQSFTLRVNHTPSIAAAAPVAVSHGTVTVPAPGLLTGAADPDGDALAAVAVGTPSSGTLTLNANGGYTWSGPQPATGTTPVTFSVASRDPFGLQSAPTTVTLNVAANVAPQGGTLGSAAAPGYALALKPTIPQSLNLEINLAYQLASPSPLVIPFTTLVNATDADGSIAPASFVATSITKVNPTTGAAIGRTGVLGSAFGGAEATATVTVSAQGVATITFTPRRTGLNTLNFAGNIDTSTTNSAGTYRITYTVRDDQGALSSPGTIFLRVNRAP